MKIKIKQQDMLNEKLFSIYVEINNKGNLIHCIFNHFKEEPIYILFEQLEDFLNKHINILYQRK